MRFRTRTAFASICILLAVPTFAWQWPVPAPEVTGTFGQDVGGYLLRGVEISGGALPVFPVERGTVVAVHNERADLPTGLGSFVVIEHDQGFRSIYAHLAAGPLPRLGSRVDVETQIAVVGESGQVRGRSLRLYIIDLRSGIYVNPMLLLPDLADQTRPTITNVFARNADSSYDLGRTTALPAGTYEISAEIYDRLLPDARSPRVMPYSIRTFVGGQEGVAAIMDGIVVGPDESRLELSGATRSRIYAASGSVRLGDVTVSTGATLFEVVATDIAGNERNWSVSLIAATPEEAPAGAP